MSVNRFNKEAGTLTRTADLMVEQKQTFWKGTKEEWEAQDKTKIADGCEVVITNDNAQIADAVAVAYKETNVENELDSLNNNLQNFSDYYNDVEIGTFNGKKVYRRYIETVATIPPSGSVKVGTFEKGVNKILDIKVIAYDSVNNYAFPLGSYLHIQIEGTDMNVFQSMSAGYLSNFTLKIYIIYTD